MQCSVIPPVQPSSRIRIPILVDGAFAGAKCPKTGFEFYPPENEACRHERLVHKQPTS